MPRRRFRGVRPAIRGLDAPALHQGRNVQPSDPELVPYQEALRHPAAREREFHVQLVDPMHQLQIGVRHRAGLIINAARPDPQHDSLAADAQPGGSIILLRSATDPPCRARRTKNHFPSVSSPVLACRVFTSMVACSPTFGAFPNTPVAPLSSWSRYCLDPVRMHVKILSQLDQSPRALHRCCRQSRIEGRAVVPARASSHGLLLARSIMPLLRGKSTCPGCSDCRNQLSVSIHPAKAS